MKTAIKYLEDGVTSTLLSRVLGSKVTYAVLLYVLAKGLPLFESADWMSVAAWKEFLPTVFGGSVVILMRSAIKKAEIASNAVNPAITNTDAVVVPKGGPNGGVTAMLVGLLALAGVSFTGCSALNALTTPDGEPVASGPVCVDTEQGRFCYMPNAAPGTAALIPPAPTPIPQLSK